MKSEKKYLIVEVVCDNLQEAAEVTEAYEGRTGRVRANKRNKDQASVQVRCWDIEQVYEVDARYPGRIGHIGTVPAGTPSVDAPTAAPKKGARGQSRGTTKSWRIGEWQSVRTGEKNWVARSHFTGLRKTDPTAYLKLDNEYDEFVLWYGKRINVTDDLAVMEALGELFRKQHDLFVAAVKEHDQLKKPAKKPAKKKA